MDIVADEAKGQWPVGAHVTHTSAEDMLTLAKHAEGQGFDLLMVAPPYMVTKTEDQVVDYVRLLAENTSLAIMFYNSPQFGIVTSAQGLKQICEIPNVVGVKEASFNQQISIDPLDVVVGTGHIEAPVRGVGEHHLLFDSQFLALEIDPLVGGANDIILAQRQVSFDGYLLVEGTLR